MMEPENSFELIKQLKARYFRFLDAKDWIALTDCLTEDVVFNYPPQQIHISGKKALIENFSTRHAFTKTAHTGSMPEITIKNDRHAEGVWFMSDYVVGTDSIGNQTITQGFGHYFEQYEFEGGSWKIKSILLERLFFVKSNPDLITIQ